MGTEEISCPTISLIEAVKTDVAISKVKNTAVTLNVGVNELSNFI